MREPSKLSQWPKASQLQWGCMELTLHAIEPAFPNPPDYKPKGYIGSTFPEPMLKTILAKDVNMAVLKRLFPGFQISRRPHSRSGAKKRKPHNVNPSTILPFSGVPRSPD